MLGKRHPRLDPFVPTGWDMVGKIIDFAEPDENSVLVDLGSGDGRMVIEAAKRYGCASIGVELNPQLVELADKRARMLGLSNVSFLNADVRTVSLEGVTHLAPYLTSNALREIEHILLTAPADAVIVTHNYPIRGWQPVVVLDAWSSSDGKWHRLYKYTPRLSAPMLKKSKALGASPRTSNTPLRLVKSWRP